MTISNELNKFARYRFYFCADCGTKRRVYLRETWRVKRIQCQACGSYWMNPSSSAKEEIIFKNQRQILVDKDVSIKKGFREKEEKS